jgi:aminopeptidase N
MRCRAGVAAAFVSVIAACTGSSPTVTGTVADPPTPTTATTSTTTTSTTTTSTATTRAAPATSTPATSTVTTAASRVVREPSTGVGDRLFPELGSADVDVLTYDLRLTVPSGVGPVEATMVIDADVAGDVEVLALDATGLDISAVRVDGLATTFEIADPELLVDLPTGREESVRAEVEYRFVPDARRSAVGLPIGWLPGDDRSYVLNEPDGARTWMPVNDHPSDKALWRFEITVPPDRVAVANGELERRGDPDGPWVWVQDEPMSTYLVQLIVGDYEVIDGGTVPSERGRALPLTHVVPTGERATFDAAIQGIAEQVAFFEDRFGPYPLDRYGLAFVEDLRNLAMETQGRSLFGADDFDDGRLGYFSQLLLSHELAHQWFGNAVSPAMWSDIWLNESFTTYAQWLWLDHVGLQPLDGYADAMLRQRQTGGGSTGEPKLDDMFGFNRYDGGAVVVHALRATMGDDAFFELMTRWVGDHVGTSQTTETFMALASEVHGADLAAFFDAWLFADTLPDSYP